MQTTTMHTRADVNTDTMNTLSDVSPMHSLADVSPNSMHTLADVSPSTMHALPDVSSVTLNPATPIKPRITVVIPTYNEAKNLVHVLPAIPDCVDEVILVDGNSRDGTVEVARELMPNIIVIMQEGKKGKGDALKLGFAAATGDIIVMIDADGSTDPREIPAYIKPLLEGYAFAKGSRFMKGGGSFDITPLRRLGNLGLCWIVNVLYWRKFSDLCYGYNAFWRYCLDYIDVDCDGFEIETLIALRITKANYRVAEVPSYEYERIHGESNLRTFRDGFRVLQTIMREFVKRVNPTTQIRHLFD